MQDRVNEDRITVCKRGRIGGRRKAPDKNRTNIAISMEELDFLEWGILISKITDRPGLRVSENRVRHTPEQE